jgi:cytosine/adenosine deaminase-related metal-dependent hydrolase
MEGGTMSAQGTIAVRGRWVLATEENRWAVLPNRYVVIEGGTIAAITTSRPGGPDRLIDIPEGLVLPGFLNLHNHAATGVLTRGLSEEIAGASFATDLIYGLLLPMVELATKQLTSNELSAVIRLGLLETIKSGTTTLMEMFRPTQPETFEAAREMGLRFYAAPYLFSSDKLNLDQHGNPTYDSDISVNPPLDMWQALFDRFDGADEGRIRVVLGPHGTDTCDPDLLRAVRVRANDLGCAITIHLAQSKAELELIRKRYDKSPVEYLRHVGLLGPDLLAAHCLYATEEDLGLLRQHGVLVLNCPLTFARGGLTASFHHFRSNGLRVGLGTDGYRMDYVAEMRSAGLVSKLASREGTVVAARELLEAATTGGAAALGRGDLGKIQPGATADLVVIDMGKPHLQPVYDPIRDFVWNANGSDVSTVIVNGQVLVDGGRFLLGDERDIIVKGAAAVRKLWQTEEAARIISRTLGGQTGHAGTI